MQNTYEHVEVEIIEAAADSAWPTQEQLAGAITVPFQEIA